VRGSCVSVCPFDNIMFYPHMPIGKVRIYHLLSLCVCVCLFVRLRISPYSLPRIKLVASYFAGQLIGVQGRESLILGNFAPPEAQNRMNRPARDHLHDVHSDHPLAPNTITQRVDVGSACVDIRQSPKRRAYLLLFFSVKLDTFTVWIVGLVD